MECEKYTAKKKLPNGIQFNSIDLCFLILFLSSAKKKTVRKNTLFGALVDNDQTIAVNKDNYGIRVVKWMLNTGVSIFFLFLMLKSISILHKWRKMNNTV